MFIDNIIFISIQVMYKRDSYHFICYDAKFSIVETILSRDSSVSKVTAVWAIEIRIPTGLRLLSSPSLCADLIWGPSSFQYSGYTK